jgi:hypothetical protein
MFEVVIGMWINGGELTLSGAAAGERAVDRGGG